MKIENDCNDPVARLYHGRVFSVVLGHESTKDSFNLHAFALNVLISRYCTDSVDEYVRKVVIISQPKNVA